MTLIGTWVVDISDGRTVTELGDVAMSFQDDGQLIYTARAGGKNQIIRLRYTVKDGVISTDQPSAPRTERTKYTLTDDDMLVLEFDGVPYRFRRAPCS